MGMGMVEKEYVMPTPMGAVAVKNTDNRFNSKVLRVLDTSILPYIVTELMWNEHKACIGHIQTPNLQIHQFRQIPQSVLDLLRTGKAGKAGKA